MGKLSELISNDIKAAMLARAKEKLEALRSIKAAFMLAATNKASHDLTEEEELSILQKLYKQRIDSADIYKANNRQELADKEIYEGGIIQQYLPKKMERDELIAALRQIVAESGASGPSEMGKVMGLATKKLSGKADGKDIAEVVKGILTGSL